MSAARTWAALVITALLASASMGCTQVRYSRRNPQTGEVWTVYSHTFSDDTVSYCAPPQWGSACMSAREVSRPPQYLPSQAYAAPPAQPWGAPPPVPWPGAPAPFPR
ncbi:MAG: hypothetical protein JST00_32105 [Deltaproteobacteria bacterium]|nr:hypothetical protein [Deltaproteobacteria bacterium]